MSAMKGSHHFLSSNQDINVIPFFILLGLVLATYGTYLWLLPKPFPGIPYNPEAARSILGDIPRLSAETSNTKDLMGWLRKQVERHQSPLVQVFIRPFAKPILVLSDYQETHDIVLHRNKDFDRSSFTTEAFGGLTPNFHIIYKTGPEWKSHRKLLQDLMTPTFLDGIAAPAIHDNMLDIVALWKLKTSLAADQPFLASQDIHNAALDAVLSFSFGKNFPFRATKPQIDLIAGISEVPTVKGEKAVAFPEATLHYGIQAMIDLAESMVQVKSSAVPRLKWWALSWTPHMARAWRDKNNCIKQEIMKSVQASKVSNTERKDERVHSAVDHIVDRETRFAQKEGRTPDYFSPIMQDE
ncbi:Cytochrome P450, partial [Macrophomina phaseolina MS6]